MTGRPTKLTPDVADVVVENLRAGNYVQTAARAAGISRQTFADWMRRGRSTKTEDAPFREFAERVEQARAECEAENVKIIADAARESWSAAAWLLERLYPERWGRPSSPQRRDASAAEDSGPESIEPDPFAEVDELAERRRTRKR
jgi:hypothetical protein